MGGFAGSRPVCTKKSCEISSLHKLGASAGLAFGVGLLVDLFYKIYIDTRVRIVLASVAIDITNV